jgi:hypothetical protein
LWYCLPPAGGKGIFAHARMRSDKFKHVHFSKKCLYVLRRVAINN